MSDNWFAFDICGTCFPLGNAGDYEAAMGVATDVLGEDWVFIHRARDVYKIADLVRKWETDPDLVRKWETDPDFVRV